MNNKSFCCDGGDFQLAESLAPQSVTDTAPALYFYHPDHLGSTAMVTNLGGHITQNVVYIPYGEVFVEERNGNWASPYLFNAKELDEETGLYYYGARYLDPAGAVWLSVDPLQGKYPGMSPYNYCVGNPVKLVDPDGMEKKNCFYIPEVKSVKYYANRLYGESEREHDVKLHNSGISLSANAECYVDNKAILHFFGHGDPKNVQIENGDLLDATDFILYLDKNSSLFRENKKNKKTTLIIMHACRTGQGEDCIAQELSTFDDLIVIAPSDVLHMSKSQGKVKEEVFEEGTINTRGFWNVFYKGKKVDSLNGLDERWFEFGIGEAMDFQTRFKDINVEELKIEYEKKINNN